MSLQMSRITTIASAAVCSDIKPFANILIPFGQQLPQEKLIKMEVVKFNALVGLITLLVTVNSGVSPIMVGSISDIMQPVNMQSDAISFPYMHVCSCNH